MTSVCSAHVRFERAASLTVLFLSALLAGGQSSRPHKIQLMHGQRVGQLAGSRFAPIFHLDYYGGPVMTNVQVVAVFWTSAVDAGEKSNADVFYSAVTNSAWMDMLKEYYTFGRTGFTDGLAGSEQVIDRGGYEASHTITPSLCASGAACTIDDVDIAAELTRQIQAGHLPPPQFDGQGNLNTLYMIYFPLNVTITLQGSQSCQVFCAYHNTTTLNSAPLAYGVIPDLSPASPCSGGCGTSANYLNNLDSVCSHELAETITDTDVGLVGNNLARPLAWYDSVNGEIGDICNGQQATTNGYTVQKLWSNSLGACVASNPNPFSLLPSQTVLSATAHSRLREPITFTATVTSSGLPVPAGFVTISDGSHIICGSNVSPGGSMSCSTTQLTIGLHHIQAIYQDNIDFMNGVSPVLNYYRSPKPR